MLLRLALLALATLVPRTSVHAQVAASLAAAEASVQPGRTVTVALRLDHQAHWHTYWINPGTGYPTSIAWTLPAGWTAGEIQWPTPQVVADLGGNITGNGYEDVTYLPVTLTPPANLAVGGSVTLRATADWLMCATVCIPGNAELQLTLPVRAETPTPHATHGAALAATVAALPRELPGLDVSALRQGDKVILQVSAREGALWPTALDRPWFFAADALVQYEQPQTVEVGNRSLTLTLRYAESYDGSGERLIGILRTDGSWVDGETRPGLAINVTLDTAPAGATAPGDIFGDAATPALGGFFGTLALAFLGGLILNLMPCVFPVLGIKIMGFVNQAGSDRRKVTIHGIVFTLGVLASFWALAASLTILRAGGDQLGWGFQLQSPAFVFALTIVLLVFALSMSGVFEFGLHATGVGAGLQMKQGYGGSFFTGVLATVVATPCSAPFLAPALGAALALPTTESFVIFTAIALGLSLPYLLLSIFPQAVKVLPRPGAWMETFKQAMAFPLYATVAYLIWVLAGQVSEAAFLTLLLALTLIAMGVWLYGRYAAPGAKPARARFGIVGWTALVLAGLWFGWPRPAAPTDVVWQPWSVEAVAAARAANQPVYIDFTARWCATCQTNKRIVFASAEVKRVFRERGFVTMRADWTNQDPRITTELAKWGRSAVPFNQIYLPGQPEPIILPELLTAGMVLDAVNQ